MSHVPARVEQLMALASGDEKHDPSAHSTLDILWVLYDRILRYDPRDPRSEDRDRFLMSKGHGPLALFAILADKGFFPAEEMARFETWEGILGGHPDRHRVPGIEVSTGSLGHGFPMAVGVALALRAKGSDRRVFVPIGGANGGWARARWATASRWPWGWRSRCGRRAATGASSSSSARRTRAASGRRRCWPA